MVEYVVLRCFSCGLFQAHQRRLDKKFKCVVCGAKQSYRHVHAVSDKASDLKSVVQDANLHLGAGEEARCIGNQLFTVCNWLFIFFLLIFDTKSFDSQHSNQCRAGTRACSSTKSTHTGTPRRRCCRNYTRTHCRPSKSRARVGGCVFRAKTLMPTLIPATQNARRRRRRRRRHRRHRRHRQKTVLMHLPQSVPSGASPSAPTS